MTTVNGSAPHKWVIKCDQFLYPAISTYSNMDLSRGPWMSGNVAAGNTSNWIGQKSPQLVAIYTPTAIPGHIGGQVTRAKFYKEVNDLRVFHLAEQNCTPEKF